MEQQQQQQLFQEEEGYQRIDGSKVCHLWAQYNCTYGDKCQFLHQGPGGCVHKKKGPCHWWAQYACPFGETCKFSHEGPGSLVEKKPKKPLKCRDYRKGKCTLGGRECPFSHDFVVPKKKTPTGNDAPKSDAEKDCINWKTKGKCSRNNKGTCPYRHDPAKLELIQAKKAKRQQSKICNDESGTKSKRTKTQKVVSS